MEYVYWVFEYRHGGRNLALLVLKSELKFSAHSQDRFC